MRKKVSKIKAGRKAQRTIADRRIEEMTLLAVEAAQRHGKPFRNPFWQNGPGRLYPLKYVKRSLKKIKLK
jgi:hypothetical protein